MACLYKGAYFELLMTHDCKEKLKSSGVFFRVLSRAKYICDTGNFGKPRKDYKYNRFENFGWLKWLNGLRVYYALRAFQEKEFLFLIYSGNKNSQKRDIHRAKKIKKVLIDEI